MEADNQTGCGLANIWFGRTSIQEMKMLGVHATYYLYLNGAEILQSLQYISITGWMLKTTEYTECQAFFQVVRIGSPHPLTRKGVLLLPPLGQRGRHTRLMGRGCGGTQFRRRDSHSGTLCILYPSTLKFSTKSGKNSSGKTFAIFEQDKFISAYELKIVIGLLNNVCEIIFLCH